MKNKLILAIIFSGIIFFAGSFYQAQAQWERDVTGDTGDAENMQKVVKGGTCGEGDRGTCMETSMFTCPTGFSFVSGGKVNCEGLSLRCCAADAKSGGGDTKKEDGDVKTGADDPGTTGTNGDKVQPLGRIDIPENLGLPNNTVKGVLTNLLDWLLGIIGVLGLMGFIISGIQYLLAYANEELAEAAKKNMTFSIIGIVVALSGFIIIQAINLALQGTAWF